MQTGFLINLDRAVHPQDSPCSLGAPLVGREGLSTQIKKVPLRALMKSQSQSSALRPISMDSQYSREDDTGQRGAGDGPAAGGLDQRGRGFASTHLSAIPGSLPGLLLWGTGKEREPGPCPWSAGGDKGQDGPGAGRAS